MFYSGLGEGERLTLPLSRRSTWARSRLWGPSGIPASSLFGTLVLRRDGFIQGLLHRQRSEVYFLCGPPPPRLVRSDDMTFDDTSFDNHSLLLQEQGRGRHFGPLMQYHVRAQFHSSCTQRAPSLTYQEGQWCSPICKIEPEYDAAIIETAHEREDCFSNEL